MKKKNLSTAFIISACTGMMFFLSSVYSAENSAPIPVVMNNTIPMISIYSATSPRLLGTLSLQENNNGVVITPALQLTPGIHALRLIPKTACNNLADSIYIEATSDVPVTTQAPFLPPLLVDSTGEAHEVMARGLSIKDLQASTVIIYANQKEYPDQVFPYFAGSIMACSR